MPKKDVKKETKEQKSHLETVTDRVGEIAVQYGFSVVKPPHVSGTHVTTGKQFKEFDYHGDVEEKVALTHWYINEKLESESQPIAIHYKKSQDQHSGTAKKKTHETYGFEIMGSNRSTSEALLLKCVLSILEDLGYTDLYIDINSIGDRESIAKFERELGNYFRKHGAELPAKSRTDFKKNHYSILTSPDGTEELKALVPQPVASLSEIARLHFKEVLEFIETFDVAYKIKPHALSNKLYASYTVFEIRSGEEMLAYGYRYNHLAKKIGHKREIPCIGATIVVKKNPSLAKKVIIKNIKKPRFYLVQLGNTAKLKALNVVEMLRKHKISVYHSITKDKITGQLSGAEYVKASHVLVMGQKEAMENTVIVRNVQNRKQETVALSDLVDFLKELK